MNMRKAIAGIVATAGLVAMSIGAANAGLVGIANAGGNNPGAGDYISYTPGTGNGLTIFTSDGHINGLTNYNPATISFTGLTNVPGSYVPPTSPGGTFSQGVSGGTFDIYEGSTVYLEGTFGPATLFGTDGGSSASINLVSDSVTYTGGTDFSSALWQATNGSLSFSLNADPSISAGQFSLAPFVANDTVTFDALPGVPEPSAMAGLGMGLLGLLGLGCLAARRRATGVSL